MPVIYLKKTRQTTVNLNQDTRSPSRDLNPGTREYEAWVLTTDHDVRDKKISKSLMRAPPSILQNPWLYCGHHGTFTDISYTIQQQKN